ncbi:MAG: O-antigen ligase family protein [Caulobacteraceae bacterium]
MLGGASQANAGKLEAIELVSLPLLFLALATLAERPLRRGASLALALAGSIFALPALQLVPLPPSMWLRLPGGELRAAALRLAGLPLRFLPMSLDPSATHSALIFLIPPIAIFLAALALEEKARERLSRLWLAMAGAGLVLGAVQITFPAASWPYLDQWANFGSPVGFFANRNHEAAFLLALLPFAFFFATRADERRLARIAALVFIPLAIVTLAAIGSRAAAALALPALALGLAVSWRGGRIRRMRARPALALAAIGLVVAAFFGLSPLAGRFVAGFSREPRLEVWPAIAALARAHMPLGAGLGAFERVWREGEPFALLGPVYFNRAHNDFLELWLDAGIPGLCLLAVFGAVLASFAWRAWKRDADPPYLARAASSAVLLLLVASAVDYPLRTEALAGLFAFCCGVIVGEVRPTGERRMSE